MEKLNKLRSRNPSQKGRRYNWLPDLPDHRDHLYSLTLGAQAPGELPPRVDLRGLCSPIVDQLKIGSCTGNALAGLLEFLELKQLREKGNENSEIFDPDNFASMSRLFIYYNERVIEGHVKEDSGAMLRDGIKSLAKAGACREALWEYKLSLLFKKPSVAAYKEGAQHKIAEYLRLVNLEEIINSLSQGFPVAFGFAVYESFESAELSRTGRMPMPGPQESMLGGHAVVAVGYDQTHRHLIVRNSWGDQWGDQGHFYMPFDYIKVLRLAQDYWTVHY